MKKIYRFFIIIALFLVSCSYSIGNVDIIKTGENDFIENFEFSFSKDKSEFENYIGRNLYSISKYNLQLDTKIFNNIEESKLVIKSTGNKDVHRIPIFDKKFNKPVYMKEIDLVENKNYEMEVIYYGEHRDLNDEWDGGIEIYLIYEEDGKKIAHLLFEDEIIEPSVPVEFKTFYEIWEYPESVRNDVNETDIASFEEANASIWLDYIVTKVYHTYKSKIDGQYHIGYISFRVENYKMYYPVETALTNKYEFDVFIFPNSYSKMSDLALKGWRAGKTAVENEKNSEHDLALSKWAPKKSYNVNEKNVEYGNRKLIDNYILDNLNFSGLSEHIVNRTGSKDILFDFKYLLYLFLYESIYLDSHIIEDKIITITEEEPKYPNIEKFFGHTNAKINHTEKRLRSLKPKIVYLDNEDVEIVYQDNIFNSPIEEYINSTHSEE